MPRALLFLVLWTVSTSTVVGAQSTEASPIPLTRPTLVLQETVQQMPRGEQQEVRVLTAAFPPSGQTVFHTHRFPVTVYVLEGEFRLDLEGQPSRTVRAGEAMVEPPGVRMTGYNTSATGPLRVIIFYVSDPGTPFLDPFTSAPATGRPN